MKMDTSFWIRYNPKITLEHTAKKYFGKYLYKIVVYAPAGRLIDSKESIETALAHRMSIVKNINHGGYWGYGNRSSKNLESADIGFLTLLRDLRTDKSLDIRLRVEEPRIQIYADNEKTLTDLANDQLKPYAKYLESVSGPEDSKAEIALNSGAILRKKDIGYKYKIIIKDGRYTQDTKKTILNYVLNIGPETVKLPQSGLYMLQKSTGFIWNLYLYSNDLNILTFLNLIQPGMVINYHELIILE